MVRVPFSRLVTQNPAALQLMGMHPEYASSSRSVVVDREGNDCAYEGGVSLTGNTLATMA